MQKCSIYLLFLSLQFLVLKLAATEDSLNLVFDKLNKITESDDVLKSELTFENKNGEVIISGKVKQVVDFDDNWMVNITILRQADAGGEFKKFFNFPTSGLCKLMQSYYKNYFYDTLKNYGNAPDPDICPVTQNNYVIENYPLDTNKFRKFLKPGAYRIIASLRHDDKEKLKYIIDAHVA